MILNFKKIATWICLLGITLTATAPTNFTSASATVKKTPVMYSEYYATMDNVGVPTFLVGTKEAIAVDTLSQLNYIVKTDKAKKTIHIEKKPDDKWDKINLQPISFMKEPKKRGAVLEQATPSGMKVYISGVPVTAYEIKGTVAVLVDNLSMLGKIVRLDKAKRIIVISNDGEVKPLPLSNQEIFFSSYTIKDFERLFGKAIKIKDEYGQTTASFYFGEVSINSSYVTVSIDSDRAKGKKAPTIIRNIDILDTMESVFAKFPKISGDEYKIGSQKGDVIYWTSPADMRRFTISDNDFEIRFGVMEKNKLDEIFIRAERTFPKANDGRTAVESLITMRNEEIGKFFKMDYETYSLENNDGDGVYLNNQKVYISFGNDRPFGFMTYNKKHSVYNINLDMTESQIFEVLKNRFPALKVSGTGKDAWNSAENKAATYKTFELNDFKNHYFTVYFDAKTKKIVAIGTSNGNN